jgi:hypothetical protein
MGPRNLLFLKKKNLSKRLGCGDRFRETNGLATLKYWATNAIRMP